MDFQVSLEQRVLSAILASPLKQYDWVGWKVHPMSNYYLVAHILKPECFTVEVYRKAFEAMVELAKDRREIDIMSIFKQGKLTSGEFGAISDLTCLEIFPNLTSNSKILFEQYYDRRLKEITTKASTGDASNLTRELIELEKEWDKFKALRPFHQMVKDVENEIDKAIENGHALIGITTGNAELDYMTGGWQNTDLIIIAGRPGMGKTARCLSFLRAAVNSGKRALFMSFEMSSGQLIKRLIAEGAGIDLSQINRGQISPYSRQQIADVAKDIQQLPIEINDNGRTSIYDIASKCRILKSQNRLDILIVDYLQIIPQGNIKANSRNDLIGVFTSELKNVAKENNIPVILMAQLNRSGEGKIDARPELHQLRESGNIEQDADFVGFIYRPSYYTKGDQTKESNSDFKEMDNTEYLLYSELIIAKHRNGKLGTIIEKFDGAKQRFYTNQ